MFLQVDRFCRTHGNSRSECEYEFVVGECQKIIERTAPIVQRNLFAVIRLPDFERIGQAVPRDMAAASIVVPNHIGYRLQPVAVPGYYPLVFRIDLLKGAETLREVLHPVVDLPFGEDPDTTRSGLFVESLAVGVVIRISEERPIALQLVIGFWGGVFADEKQDAVSSETGADFLCLLYTSDAADE